MTATADRTESLFAAAVALATPTERAAYLDQACADDPTMRARIEALLRAHDKAGHLLDKPAPAALEQQGEAGVAEALTVPPGEKSPARPGLAETGSYHGPSEGVGAVIAGKYKLLETLGQGGMGAVFMAQQTAP